MESQHIIDLAAALDRFDGDHDLFLTLAELFVERAPVALSAIDRALADQDMPMLMKEAHKMKGSALEFCAHQAVAAAAHLEQSARTASALEMVPFCDRVHAEIQRLTTALKVIIEKGLPS